jgi:hypothetical protein
MAFRGIKDVVDAELDGKVGQYAFTKTISQATSTGIWFDYSMSSGNPGPKYWFDAEPLTAKAIYQSTDGGLYHGGDVSPSAKYLRSFTFQASSANSCPSPFIICDYLLYYPTVDEGTTAPQVMDNTITLPRYTNGSGVQMIAVSLAGRTGNQSFSVSYTNSEGVSGRTSLATNKNGSTGIGSIVTCNTAGGISASSPNPFIQLQSGDTGVRSVESVTMNGVDVGLFSIVLVKPVAYTLLLSANVIVEKDFLIMSEQLPIIQNDAYLSFLSVPQGNMSANTVRGDIKVIWD